MLCLRVLLIQIGVKPSEICGFLQIMFESIVNSDRCQTATPSITSSTGFESIVNSDRCQTNNATMNITTMFESIVNSDRCQTVLYLAVYHHCLRVLLIQIGVKLI